MDEVKNYIVEAMSIAENLLDIIVVVNSDKKHQLKIMEAELTARRINRFRVIDYGENVGYLNAMLMTIDEMDLSQYGYIVLSNTDIHYETDDFFQRLVLKDYSKAVGCIAPSVFSEQSNCYSNPHYMSRIPKEKIQRNIMIFKHPLLGRLYLKLSGLKARCVYKEKKKSCYVYSPHGCYMIFSRDFIDRIKGYRYGVKLYSEESAIGELLIKNGMKCFYDDSLSVIHQESTVTGTIDYRNRFNAWKESLEYILRQFYQLK